jgi:hypothetical protein
MSDDFTKYELMKRSGSSPTQVYLESVRDNVDNITRIRLIRSVFSLSMREYKEVWVRAEGIAESLEQHEENIFEILKPILTKKTEL